MTPEQQRIVIAGACGWKHERLWTGELHGKPVGEQGPFREVPDYLNDLNAMHQAVMAQPDSQKWEIFEQLLHIVPADIPAACADASQWAKAFLEALNLWQP